MKGSSLFILNSILLIGLVVGAIFLQNVQNTMNTETSLIANSNPDASANTVGTSAPVSNTLQITPPPPPTIPPPQQSQKPSIRGSGEENERYDD